jgi:hypothetical protein
MLVDMELETVLRPPQLPMTPYTPKVIMLANGKWMVVRQAERSVGLRSRQHLSRA